MIDFVSEENCLTLDRLHVWRSMLLENSNFWVFGYMNDPLGPEWI